MLPSDRPDWALLSVLGVPGWGPLHWLLKQRGDRLQLAARLRQSLRAAALPVDGTDVPAGQLLTALLRAHGDLDPVAAVADRSVFAGLRYRHRLVCRDGSSLVLRSWERGGCGEGDDGGGGWFSLGPGQALEVHLQAIQHGPEGGSQANAGGSCFAVGGVNESFGYVGVDFDQICAFDGRTHPANPLQENQELRGRD